MDFYAPQFQPPADVLGAYLRGQTAPLQLQQEQQKTEEGALSLQQMRLAMKMHQQQMEQLAQVYGKSSGAGPQVAPPNAAPPANATPQGAQAGMPAAGGSPLDNFISSAGDRLSKLAQVGSINAAYSGGDPVKPFKDALEVQSAERDSQIKTAQLQAQMTGSPLSIMRSFANNPNAGDAMLKNPQMIPHWEQAATTVGRNPNDLSNENVRVTAALIARQHEAALQLPEAQWTKMPELYSKPTAGPGGTRLQSNLNSGEERAVVGREPVSVLAGNAPSIPADDPRIKSWVGQVLAGNATMQQVPMGLRTSVAEAMNNAPKSQYSPMAASRLTLASSRITQQFTNMSAYKLTADGKPYLERIDAALTKPGSVSDQDLLDSLTKLNTGGNAITDAQVSLVTHGKSFSDMANTFANKFRNGGVLSNDQRQQIHDIAYAIFDNYKKGYQPIYEQAAQQLTDAGIPKAFWTIPDLNNLNGPSKTASEHPADIQAILRKVNAGG